MNFFPDIADVNGFMTLRPDGDMKADCGKQSDEAKQNRARVFEKENIPPDQVVSACLAHSNVIAYVRDADEQRVQGVDGLLTDAPNVFLTVTVADCYPIFFYDPWKKIVGIAHAGWRGTVKNVAAEMVGIMKSHGSNAEDILVRIGPGISQANFLFGQKDFLENFGIYRQDKYVVPSRKNGKLHISLQAILREQLTREGIQEKNFTGTAECTYTQPDTYFSKRHDKLDPQPVMMAVIGRTE